MITRLIYRNKLALQYLCKIDRRNDIKIIKQQIILRVIWLILAIIGLGLMVFGILKIDTANVMYLYLMCIILIYVSMTSVIRLVDDIKISVINLYMLKKSLT